MTVLAFPFPVSLTKTDWHKRNKTGTKTGVGDTLLALQNAFAKAPFGKVDPDALGAETVDPVAFREKATAVHQAIAGAAQKLNPLIAASDQAMSKAIPLVAKGSNQDVRKHLEQMRKQLTQFTSDLDDYADEVVDKARAAYRASLHKTAFYASLSDVRKTAPAEMSSLLLMIKKVGAAKTIDSIHATFGGDGPHRGLTTNCKVWDQLVVPRAPALVKAVGGPTNAMSTVAKMEWLMEVANEEAFDATRRVKAVATKLPDREAVQQFVLDYTQNVIKARDFIKIMIEAAKMVDKI